MDTHSIRLFDSTGRCWATAIVTDEGSHFGGTVDLHEAPANLRALFDEFEECVNGQMFSFLDDIQTKIAAHGVRVQLDDGFEAAIDDLQVFPTTGDISFKLVGSPASSLRHA